MKYTEKFILGSRFVLSLCSILYSHRLNYFLHWLYIPEILIKCVFPVSTKVEFTVKSTLFLAWNRNPEISICKFTSDSIESDTQFISFVDHGIQNIWHYLIKKSRNPSTANKNSCDICACSRNLMTVIEICLCILIYITTNSKEKDYVSDFRIILKVFFVIEFFLITLDSKSPTMRHGNKNLWKKFGIILT